MGNDRKPERSNEDALREWAHLRQTAPLKESSGLPNACTSSR